MKHGPPAARAQPRTPARAIPPSGRGRGSRSLFGRRSHVLSTRLSHVLHQRPRPAEGSRLRAAPLIHRLGRVGWIYLAEIVWLDFFFFFSSPALPVAGSHPLARQLKWSWEISHGGRGQGRADCARKEGCHRCHQTCKSTWLPRQVPLRHLLQAKRPEVCCHSFGKFPFHDIFTTERRACCSCYLKSRLILPLAERPMGKYHCLAVH